MRRNAFTLVELLIVISIIAILAGLSMAALMGASEQGRIARAEAQITKIDQLIGEKWNSYRFRQLPIRVPSSFIDISTNPPQVVTFRPAYANRMRLDTMRELQRLELPDRMSDVLDNPVSPSLAVQDPYFLSKGGPVTPPQPIPALTRAYRRYFSTTQASTNSSYESAECLYAIISQIRDGDKSALEFFMNSEIGDADQDGAFEILDPWGEPIMFLRWAPGYSNALASDLPPNTLTPPAPQPSVVVATFQRPDGAKPDSFDPLKIDPRWSDNSYGFKPFQIRPLIFSGGPDRIYDIFTDDKTTALRYSQTGTSAPFVANDPYHVMVLNGGNVWIGSPADYAGDGLQNGDNITNHGMELKGK